VCSVVFVVSVSGRSQQSATQVPQTGGANNTESEITTRTPEAQIKVHVNLVLVRVVVRDAAGKEVAGLKKEDFKLLDNGKEQKITTFNLETVTSRGTGPLAAEAEAKTGSSSSGGAVAHSDAAGPNVAETEGPTGVEAAGIAATAMPQRFVALVIDDLHMKANESLAVRAAAEKLFSNLAATDRAAIYTTSGDVQQSFIGDAETLRRTLTKIIPRVGKGEGEYECPTISYYMADLINNKQDTEALETALLDARNNNCPMTPNDVRANADRILRAGDQNTRLAYQSLEHVVGLLASMPGQRVMVYVSPGFLLNEGVMPANSELLERAMRAGIVVNTIDAKTLYTVDPLPDIAAPPQQPMDKTDRLDYQIQEATYRVQSLNEQGQVLAGIAASTGGTYFHNRNDLDVGMNQALSAPSVSYLLGFAPQNLKIDGKFHKLKVTVENGQKFQIQARNGYYVPKMLADPEEMVRQEVRSALFAQDEIVDVPIDLKTQFFKTDAGSAQLSVLTHMDLRGIHFRKADGRNYNNVVLATAVFDGNGQFVEGQMREINMKLLDSSFQRLSTTGMTVKISFTVKPGAYLVRSVLGASEGEQLTARNATTVIP
jgi:VWFA-related protein